MPRLKSTTTTIVDQLGKLKAQISDLQAKEKELKQQLIESGIEADEGKLFRVTVSRFEKTTINYSEIVKELKPKQSILDKFTRISEQVMVRVTAKNGN